MMKLRIFNGRGAVDRQLEAHLKRRLDFALAGLGDRVVRILVRLSHGALASANPSKRCEIEVVMLPRSVSVTETGADMFIAVQNAAHRLKRSVTRALEREQAWYVAHPSVPVPVSAARRGK
jgi:ribosome-associated translation inhibitor RaiA